MDWARKKSSRLNSVFTFISEFYNYNSDSSRKQTIITDIYSSGSTGECDPTTVKKNKPNEKYFTETLQFPSKNITLITYIAREFLFSLIYNLGFYS